ncbi:hypothetical protein L8P35_17820 [Enterobacter cloacae]|uniref:hypothetical protein n=1 Tax=Enterobacter cloacae TaxID=550 RepID=UPI00200688F7|nr:hypothetical protein [Enterobacter cloacae]MCK7318544.1 hypothetical protein [Enterobacter cloacae]
MEQDWSPQRAANFSYGEILERLHAVSAKNGFTDTRHAAIFRQIKVQGLTSMSDRQWRIFRKEMVPLTVQHCCPGDGSASDRI